MMRSSDEEQRWAVMRGSDEATRASTLTFTNAGAHPSIHQRRRPHSHPGVRRGNDER